MDKVIWWVRRDLRLGDNQALAKASTAARLVIPIFIIDPKLVNSPNMSKLRLTFLWEGLKKLDSDLRTLGSELIIRQGSPKEMLTKLVKESGAGDIYAESDFSPYARQRDREVSNHLPLNLVGGPGLSHPEAVLKKDGTPYLVYSHFRRTWKSIYMTSQITLSPKPDTISTPAGLIRKAIPALKGINQTISFDPGESVAQKQLRYFTGSDQPPIYQYADLRNRMDLNGTARLSPYLRFGMLSARQCVAAANKAMEEAPDDQARKSAETWLDELIWREFYLTILYHYQYVLRQSFREDLRDIAWRNDPEEFAAWCDGRTGYPVVDAAMRQLLNTGWMHNRARMIVASFLVKDLLVDWRWGERWFLQQLIDGDPAANNGGWQWTAGTGMDAAPYFRIFNPILQGKKYDPMGDFVRQWVPELAEVPQRYIHTPWMMPPELQRQTKCIIGRDYPQPIVDHSFARERALEAYKQTKQTSKE
jgi:deoxyribodipyrimidine photo-lyase